MATPNVSGTLSTLQAVSLPNSVNYQTSAQRNEHTFAESGVPTFREAQTGLWARYSPEELATPEAFAATPARVTDWYRWRRGIVAVTHRIEVGGDDRRAVRFGR